jgi:hypothetical protein
VPKLLRLDVRPQADDEDPIRPDTEVTVAQSDDESRTKRARKIVGVDDNEVVAAGLHLVKAERRAQLRT